jgi:hypothetical protein
MNWKEAAKIGLVLVIAMVFYFAVVSPLIDKYKDKSGATTL